MRAFASLMFVAGMSVWLTGCDGQVQQATQKVEEAAESAQDAAAEVVEKTEEAVGELGDEFKAATEEATKALESVEGGTDLLAKVNELFASAASTLTAVTDEATAGSAVEKLGALSLSADSLKPLIENLPDSAKASVVGLIVKGIPQIKALVAKVLSIPGVEAVLKPKLDELLGKLTGLTGMAE